MARVSSLKETFVKNDNTYLQWLKKLRSSRAIKNEISRFRQVGEISEIKIIVLGDTGAGKSSTINSILNESLASTVSALSANATDAVVPFSRRVKECTFTVVDTPGLQEKVSFAFSSVIKIMRYLHLSPMVDVFLFCKRMDVYSSEPNERATISILTTYMGRDIWRRTVLVLTRAACPLRVGKGSSMETVVLKRLNSFRHIVYQESNSLIALATFVENCRARVGRDGEMVLPDGSVWIIDFFESILKLIEIDPLPYQLEPEWEKRLSSSRQRKWPIPFLIIVHLSLRFCLRTLTVEDNLTGDSEGPFQSPTIAR
eukprot:gnl/MRDRNA2_/MRDRNA2_85187_c0_seq1.p1 gnl/MRDRNA2_/MRDRNA2_85187_c0~~gnl/MRDRNA2_/MRDRNA2_85187_c0_seq1.p1  ORF type:complete len:351 (+),score=-9.19 gnl/MRDRNA2_/MRDRNA2_85187_c0_seq1:114-1055(+)